MNRNNNNNQGVNSTQNNQTQNNSNQLNMWNPYAFPLLQQLFQQTQNTNQQQNENQQNQQNNIPLNQLQFFNLFTNMQCLEQMFQNYQNNQNTQNVNENNSTEEIETNGSIPEQPELDKNFIDILRDGLPQVTGNQPGRKIEIPHITWIGGQRNTEVLCVDGAIFHWNNGNSYRCKHYRTTGCPVHGKLLDNGEFKYVKSTKDSHNHTVADYLNYVQKEENIKAAKDEKNAGKTATQIYNETIIQGATQRRSLNLGQIQKALETNPTPHTVSEIVLSDEEKEYLVFQDKEMLVFADKSLYECVKQSPHYYIDGTFKSVTQELFYQLYSVHFENNGGVFPAFYSLMIDKKPSSYQKMFDIIERELGEKIFHMKKVVLGDFEIQGIKAFGPEIDKRACYFHFVNNIFRRAKKEAYKEYKARKSYHACCKTLMVMPLIPKHRINEALQFMKQKYKSEKEKSIIEYFERNYILKRYKMDFWWIGDLNRRTNNNVESFNSMLNRFIRIHNPPIHKFIKKLNEIIKDVNNKATLVINHDNRPRTKVIVREKNRSIKNILENEENENIQLLICHLIEAANIDKKIKEGLYDDKNINDESSENETSEMIEEEEMNNDLHGFGDNELSENETSKMMEEEQMNSDSDGFGDDESGENERNKMIEDDQINKDIQCYQDDSDLTENNENATDEDIIHIPSDTDDNDDENASDEDIINLLSDKEDHDEDCSDELYDSEKETNSSDSSNESIEIKERSTKSIKEVKKDKEEMPRKEKSMTDRDKRHELFKEGRRKMMEESKKKNRHENGKKKSKK